MLVQKGFLYMKIEQHIDALVEKDNSKLFSVELVSEQECRVCRLTWNCQHLLLKQVKLNDITDIHNELVQESDWLLHPSESLELCGNLFVVENILNGSGKIFVKDAPLAQARKSLLPYDLRVCVCKDGGFIFELIEEQSNFRDSWTVLGYTGGIWGQKQTLQQWQRQKIVSKRKQFLPLLLSNTWGDNSKDTKISQSFIESELSYAHRMGIDIIELDDGWQKGNTAKVLSIKDEKGVWQSFWNYDPYFWDVHKDRFPNGLLPIVEKANSLGIKIGLWFMPDSWNDFFNWQKDAEKIIEWYNDFGIEHFKIDAIVAPNKTAFENLNRFFEKTLEASDHKIVFDLDITNGVRPGYFGSISTGPLFVENRYTDWHNYWPHQTLRNLWKLTHWIDPLRLRMEFLNNSRNADKYINDPLSPACYSPETLFATVMFSNPIGWFEVSNLPEQFVESVSKLVKIWKLHRKSVFEGTIVPIGSCPDGISYTGFVSISPNMEQGYVLVFRELNDKSESQIILPDIQMGNCNWDIIAGNGLITSNNDKLNVKIADKLGFVFAKFSKN
jgi:alpha-galactosidase